MLIIESTLSTPPETPVHGATYSITGTPTDEWSARTAGDLAQYQFGSWIFRTPPTGMRAYSVAQKLECVFNGTAWFAIVSPWNSNYAATHATPADDTRVGKGNSSSSSYPMDVPTGEELWIMKVECTVRTGGEVSGTYTAYPAIEDKKSSTIYTIGSGKTHEADGVSTYLRFSESGTLTSPLLTLAATARPAVGWQNHSSSPGAFESSQHHCWVTGYAMRELV